MKDRTKEEQMSIDQTRKNSFEFVVVAGARAKQLLRGCAARTTGSDKVTKLAQKEVLEGKVEKVPRAD
jgi:DNA-directed RNA polymerase subunit K/omega